MLYGAFHTPQKNGAGKLFDANARFRLCITLTGATNDPAMSVLTRMAHGVVIAYPTIDRAIQAQQDWHRDAQFVVNEATLATYGFSVILDTKDGGIHNPTPITENRDKTKPDPNEQDADREHRYCRSNA